jgi:hypothetical protein
MLTKRERVKSNVNPIAILVSASTRKYMCAKEIAKKIHFLGNRLSTLKKYVAKILMRPICDEFTFLPDDKG